MSSSAKVTSFIRWFDFSQQSVSLRVNKAESYASTAGGVCSFMMILLIVFAGISDLISVFQKPQLFN